MNHTYNGMIVKTLTFHELLLNNVNIDPLNENKGSTSKFNISQVDVTSREALLKKVSGHLGPSISVMSFFFTTFF